jgi:hypothetical protein
VRPFVRVQLALAVLTFAAGGVLARERRREAMPLVAVGRMAAVTLPAMAGVAVVAVEHDP